MTVPGGVPNLPVGGMTPDNLAERVQDFTAETVRNVASLRFPSIFDGSTGGSVLSDLSPFGIITRIWSEVNSAIANADPADINGPEDIPPLLLDFIESLPVVGELVGLMEAILGTYTGDDAVLLAIQQIFMPIRKLLQLVSGQPVGWPTVEETTSGWVALGNALTAVATDTATFLSATGQSTFALLGAALQTLISWLSAIPAHLLSGSVPLLSIPALPLSQMPLLGGYLTNLSPSGLLSLTGLGTGALPVGISTAISQVDGLAAALAAALTSASPLNAANLTGFIAQARAPWAAQIDTFMAAWGATGSGYGAVDLQQIAQNISPEYVVGLLGAENVGNTIQGFLDAGVQAIQQNTGLVNNSISQWNNSLSSLAQFLGFVTSGAAPVNSVAQITSFNSDNIKQRAVQKATHANLDRSFDATFDLAEINTLATLPTIPVTRTKSVIGYITVRDGGIKQSAGWLGYGVTNVTEFYVNLYTVDKTTGDFVDALYSSPNLISGVGSGSVPVWNSLNDLDDTIPEFSPATQGDLVGIEFSIRGSGTYNIVGKTMSGQLPTHLTAKPAFFAAGRNVDIAPSVTSVSNTRTSAINTPNPLTLTINVGANDNAVVLGVSAYQVSTVSATITFASQPMTLVGASYNYVTNSYLYFYAYQFPTGTITGNQTISFSYSGGSWLLEFQAWSMKDVGSFGTAVGASGSGSSISQIVSSNATQYLLNIMAQNTTGNNITGYNKTLRTTNNFVSGTVVPNVFGDAAGATSVTFSATVTGGGGWGSYVLPVNGVVRQPPNPFAEPGDAGSPAAYSVNVPWAGLSGTASQTQYSPVLTPMMDLGAQPYDPPAWANYFDVIVWPAGGGGMSGAGFVGGFGGGVGSPIAITLTKDQISGADWTWTNGVGGAGHAPYAVPGGNGGNTVVIIPGYGTITTYGGAGATNSTAGATGLPGASAPAINHADAHGLMRTYPGGAGGGSPQANGQQPGGAGAGGNATYLTYVGGGSGAPGGGYVLAYQ